jgi:hypothetical protein
LYNGKVFLISNGIVSFVAHWPEVIKLFFLKPFNNRLGGIKEDGSVVMQYGSLPQPIYVDDIAGSDTYWLALLKNGTVLGRNQETYTDPYWALKIPPGLKNVRKISCPSRFVAYNDYGFALTGNLPDKPARLSGKVIEKGNGNCVQDPGEKGLANRIVIAQPGSYYSITDSSGKYSIVLDSGSYQVSQILNIDQSLNQLQVCPSNNQPYSVASIGFGDTVQNLNFANEQTTCPRLKVSVGSNRRRRCLRNFTQIQYQNQGFGAASNVQIHLRLPNHVRFISSDKTYTFSASDSIYRFNVGVLTPNQKGTIQIVDSVACINGLMGIEQCTKAWITSSEDTCSWSPEFDRSNIVVKGICGSQPKFKVYNLGRSMSNPRKYCIFING